MYTADGISDTDNDSDATGRALPGAATSTTGAQP